MTCFNGSRLIQIWREEGWRGLWRGFAPCAIRALPTNAAGFLGYESAAAVMRKWELGRKLREQEAERKDLLQQQRAEKQERREQHRRQRQREGALRQRQEELAASKPAAAAGARIAVAEEDGTALAPGMLGTRVFGNVGMLSALSGYSMPMNSVWFRGHDPQESEPPSAPPSSER